MKRYLLFTLLLINVKGFSQNIKTSNLSWSSTNTMDVSMADNTQENTTFVNYGSTKVEWRNSDGTVRQSLNVIEVLGDWSNVASTGRIVYEISDGGNTRGTITFSKDSNGTKVLMVIVTSNQSGISDPPHVTELTIQGVQTI